MLLDLVHKRPDQSAQRIRRKLIERRVDGLEIRHRRLRVWRVGGIFDQFRPKLASAVDRESSPSTIRENARPAPILSRK